METCVEPGKVRTPPGARQGLSSQAGSGRGQSQQARLDNVCGRVRTGRRDI